MSVPQEPLVGASLLEAINSELVALHRRYHHREPVSARTQLLGDDLIACVMGGVYTEVEKTMIELQRSPIVRDVRSAFQVAMFTSDSHVGPDLEIELFLLAGGDSLVPPPWNPDDRGV